MLKRASIFLFIMVIDDFDNKINKNRLLNF